MKIETTIKPATPWNVTLAALKGFEAKIVADDRSAMEARWLFGRELLHKRVDYKGKLGVPRDLMKRTIEECKLSEREIKYRIQFAERYPTKKEFGNAVAEYKSWHQMVKAGLVEKKRATLKKSKPKHKSEPQDAQWLIRKLIQQVDDAFTHHATLSREHVKDLELLHTKVQALLHQIDRNDNAQAQPARKVGA